MKFFDTCLELSAARKGLMLMFLIPVRIECCFGRFDNEVFDTC